MNFWDWLTGSSDESAESEDTRTNRVFEMETVTESTETTRSTKHTWTRSIELVHFSNDDPMLVAYDEMVDTSNKIKYRVYEMEITHETGRAQRSYGLFSYPIKDTPQSRVNSMAVTHRDPVGSFDITMEREANVIRHDTFIDGFPSVEDLLEAKGKYRDIEFKLDGRDVDPSDQYYAPPETVLDDATRFYRCKHTDRPIWNREYEFDSWASDLNIEYESTLTNLVRDHFQGDLKDVQIITPEGQILRPDRALPEGE